MAEQLEPVLCEAERSAKPCGEVACAVFRIGGPSTGSPLIPRCQTHAEEFRALLQRFMRAGAWSEERISRD